MELEKIYHGIARCYFVVATVALLVMAFVIFTTAIVEVVMEILAWGSISTVTLRSVGLLIIGFAIVETATFIAEEEMFSKRELRASAESRRSLTKFVTIIVIASSLEALVMIFSASRNQVSNSIYSAFVFFVAMFGLIALGSYQWLSSRIRYDGDP